MSRAAVVHKYVDNVVDCTPRILPHMNVLQSSQEGICRLQDGEENYSAVCKFGVSLEQIISDRKPRINIRKAILLQLAHGVHHLHSNGLVHREIAKENIFFTENKKTVVLLHPNSFHHANNENDKQKDIKDLSSVFSFVLEHPYPNSNEFEDTFTRNDLIEQMKSGNFKSLDILRHPYFWDDGKRLDFLCKVSQASKSSQQHLKEELNQRNHDVILTDWRNTLKIVAGEEKAMYEKKLTERRKRKSKIKENVLVDMAEKHKPPYDYSAVQSLLCFMRNRREHFWESSLESQACFFFGPSKEFLEFFCSRFPKLFFTVYDVVKKSTFHLKGITDVYLSSVTENTFLLPEIRS